MREKAGLNIGGIGQKRKLKQQLKNQKKNWAISGFKPIIRKPK
ncbi:MAG: hypothetical protein ACOC1X_03705 [Promethearchaeota archaeon]